MGKRALKPLQAKPSQKNLRRAKQSPKPLLGDPLLGATLAGSFAEYRIIIPVAEGGNSRVYQAVQMSRKDIPALVAVKVISENSTEMISSHKEKFMKEAKAMLKVNHPNLVKIFDLGEHDGHLFMVSEYVPGPSLGDMIENLYPVGEPESAKQKYLGYMRNVFLQICSGLAAIHNRGFAYGDMKPANVICTNCDMDSNERGITVKIVDFGTVSPLNSKDDPLFIECTLPYAAPELFDGAGYDRRTEVYALGVVLYEMLTGLRPFRTDNLSEIIEKHRKEIPESPSKAVPNMKVSKRMDDIVLKALEKDPDDRYQTVEEFEADIRKHWHEGGWADGFKRIFSAGAAVLVYGAAAFEAFSRNFPAVCQQLKAV